MPNDRGGSMLRYAITGSAVLAVALGGCGASEKASKSPEEMTSAATSVAAAAKRALPNEATDRETRSAGPDSLAPKPKADITVDGKAAELTGPVQCGVSGNEITILVGGMAPGASFAAARLLDGSELKVTDVVLNDAGTLFLLGGEFAGSGTASKTADGYTIKGEGTGGDGVTPKQMAITMDVTCPKAGGGAY
ncbi:hypothetical protein BI330_20340 [Mycobacterium sp. CBMA 623]|nr:hypothetical protein [Mycobacteroides sp. CBMA 326]